MSEFSDKCRAYIAKSNTNVYQISKKSGLDRTMLQKMVKGTKVPSPPFFEKFCEFLAINKVEKNELDQLFKIERIGRDVYTRRCEIEHLFKDFKNLKAATKNMLSDNWLNAAPQLVDALQSKQDIKLSTEVDLVDTMRYVINEECDNQQEPIIYMDVFDTVPFGLNQLIRCGQRTDKKITCTQFVKFGRSDPSHNVVVENIRTLRTIFPFAFKFTHDYDVYYSYINGNRYDETYNIWPHYVVTQSKVLLISEKGDEGLLINSSEIAGSYIERLERMKENCDRLFDFSKGDNWRKQGARNVNKKPADAVCDRGVTDCAALEYNLPEEREQLLEVYCSQMAAKGYRRIQVKKGTEESGGLTVEFFEPNYIVFCSMRKEFPFGIICIKETELYEAFLDYFDSLDNSKEAIPEEAFC